MQLQEVDTMEKRENRRTRREKLPKQIKSNMSDNIWGNYFNETHGLIMNAKPYLKRLVLSIPRRTPENRILYMNHGEAKAKINFMPFDLKSGDLIVVPSNYILLIEEFTDDVDPWLLDFHYNTNEERDLIGIETLSLHLSEEEKQIVHNYFNLMYQIDSSLDSSNEDVMHLIMSMLYCIKKMNEVRTGNVRRDRMPRVKLIKSEFINMVVANDVPQLTISDLADALGVSENYLSIIIKQETGQTVKKWIEQKTETLIKLLLTEPENHTLGEIAKIVGYSSPPQVVRFFKRRTGMTPYEYRKSKMEEIAAIEQ